MVEHFFKAATAVEALQLRASWPAAQFLAGGTTLLAAEFKDLPLTLISVEGILPSFLQRDACAQGERIRLGANAVFQDIVDWPQAPLALRDAALAMADRNIRNRATVGGNIGTDKSSSNLVPLFLALDAVYHLADGRSMAAVDWHAALRRHAPSRGTGDLIASVECLLPPTGYAAYAHWSRTACDLSVLTASLAFTMDPPCAGKERLVKNIRIALGGVDAQARRFPAIEALFEARPLPSLADTAVRASIEAAILPHLSPVSDLRGSAAFKKLRAAALITEALLRAAPLGAAVAASATSAASVASAPSAAKEAHS